MRRTMLFAMAVLMVLILTTPGCQAAGVVKVPPKLGRPESTTADWADVDKEANQEPIDKPVLRQKTKAGLEKSRDVIDPAVDNLLDAQHEAVDTVETLQADMLARDKKIVQLEAKQMRGPMVLYWVGALVMLAAVGVAWITKDPWSGIPIGIGGAAICAVAAILDYAIAEFMWLLWLAIPLGIGVAVWYLMATKKGKGMVDDARTTLDTLVSSIGLLPKKEQAAVLDKIRKTRGASTDVVKAEVKAAKERTKTK